MSAFLSLLFTPPRSNSGSHSSSNASAARPNAQSQSQEGMRQCWICFGEEPLSPDNLSSTSASASATAGNRAKWVRPCKCSGTTAWVHQGCLLDWTDVKMRSGHPLSAPITCPQCHAPYRISERYGVPWPILTAVSALNRVTDRMLMYAALSGLCVSGYGGLFGYGAAVFTAAVGPHSAYAFFMNHFGVGSAESVVKIFLGMPIVALSVLAAIFPSLSWVFPIIPPILYANDIIEWNVMSPKLLALSLPFALFAYRLGEVYMPRYIAALVNTETDAADDSTNNIMSLERQPQQEQQEQQEMASPAGTEYSQWSSALDTEDENAIRFSIHSTTATLFVPFLSAAIGLLIAPRRLLPFYRMLIGGVAVVSMRDLIRSITWYQQVLIRPYRRVLNYRDD